MSEILLMLKIEYARLEQAKKDYSIALVYCDNKKALKHHKTSMACSKRIRELTLLLKDESKQPQPPISQTPMLGEVPPVVNSGTEENLQAVEGATPVVRQNEQVKEHLTECSCVWPQCNHLKNCRNR